MRHLAIPGALPCALALLTGCAALIPAERPDPAEAPAVRTAAADTIRPEARPATGEEAAPTPAAVTPGPGGLLGRTTASLGNPAEPGMWLATPLVQSARPGRIRAASGASAAVELRPSGGAPGSGSRLSLAGFQALGLPVTALPELEVLSD